ncbi:hypothetical protein Taro_054884, partial [Colocasia esculenta]|nr:hypothetical protein [Colocasia esculenta]
MVRGGRSRTISTSVGRGSASPSTTWTASPSTPVVQARGTASPLTTRVVPPFPSSSPPEVESQHPAVEEGPQLPGRQPCWISGFVFTRPKDLPRARAVWESTAQTNFRKSMWETRDKAMKTTGNRDPMAWLDYGPRWAAGPWQERSQAAKRNRSSIPEKNVHASGSVSYATHNQKLHHELKRAPTFRELFDRTHKRKGTDDYETYDRTMAEHYAEGTPQPDLDPEAWVDAAGGPRKGRVYGFGDSLDTHPVLSSYASSIAPPAYASSSAAPPVSGVEEIRDLILEELRAQLQTQQAELQTQFGDMVQQLILAMQGVRPTQPAPQ